MRTLVLLLAAVGVLGAVEAPEWAPWAPRDEIAPKAWVDDLQDRGEGGSLALSGRGNPAVFGGWTRLTGDVEAGAWYRLTAYYRTAGLASLDERQAVMARVDWKRADGKRAGRPEYAFELEDEGGWTRVSVTAPAPEQAAAAQIQLLLVNAPQATVWFDDVTLTKTEKPAERKVKVVSVNLRPKTEGPAGTIGSPAANLDRFAELIERKVASDADLILLPEGVTIVGTRLSYADVAEPVPGPVTERLGEIARSKKAYVAAGIYEREGSTLYNTAVLLDREGRLVGKYRKVYLPREEFEGGLTPGSDYPVFQTDFGTVGMMICWDLQYADPARALALRGAEMVLMPIWGGEMTLARARAIENHVYLVSSGYDHPTYVMDPMGEILSQAPEEGTVAEAVIDLNRRFEWDWLGEMRGRFFHELRRDVAVVPSR